MVRKKLQLPISSFDAYHDMRRSRAMWLTPTEKELHAVRKSVKEDDNIDKNYKKVLLLLCSTFETPESQNEEKDKDEGNHNDYSSGETDPEYRKPDGESSVLDCEKEGALVVSQYRDMCSDEECECCVECYLGERVGAAEHGEPVGPLETDMNNSKVVLDGKGGGVTCSKRGRSRKLIGVEIVPKLRNVDRTMLNHTVVDQMDLRLTRSRTCTIGENNWRKNIPPSPPTKKTSARTKCLGQEVKIEENKDKKRGRPRKSHSVIQKPHEENKRKRGQPPKSVRTKTSSGVRKSRNMSEDKGIKRCSDFMNDKSRKNINGINIKTEVEDESSPGKKRGRPRKSHAVIQKPSREENKRKHGQPPKSVRTKTSSGVRKSRNMSEEIGIKRCSEFMIAKARKNINGINIKTEVEDESSPDNVDVYPCPKIIYRNIHEDGSEKGDRSSPSNTFREQLLSVLEKPYDREEYFKHFESFRSGKYVVYYPAVQRKLTKYKCKLPRRLTILRGFFFWLQHLTREGAFQPWKDLECLSVVPEPPLNPSTSKNYGASRSKKQKK